MSKPKYVSYTRSAPNNEYSDLSYYNGVKDGAAALKLQEEHIAAYAASHGVEIIRSYTDGMDGDSDGCGDSAFQSLLSDGIGRKFDGVIVDSIDRCGPSLWDAREVLLDTFQYAGIHFIVVQEDFDSSVGNEAAEDYFQEKYRDWKRGHMQSEPFTKMWNAPAPVKEKGKPKRTVAKSPLTGLIFNARTDRPLNMKTIDGVQYFLRSYNIPTRMEGRSLRKEEMESLVMDALDAEKVLADRAVERIKNGDGKDIAKYRLSLVGAQMKQEFDRLAVLEFAEVGFTKAYENGEIPEEEYHRRRTAQQDALLEADKAFQEAEDAGDKVEKSLGFTNPWIMLMQSWERPEKLTRPVVKKYLRKISVRDFRTAEITTTMDEWKKLLPSEWLLC